ncbi:AAA family ATPase [Sulfurovum sp. NBC37-1]|uniref:AAA family ATPase n=1 Tax=Sulfurovum sp. (strain NBC37-1) TaxID=387093 RepID=UPI000158743B|nr:AAA family ATPase [Sulfurovum sp. NBC37-1]BAF72054.1 ATP-dependent peptidase, M41 family [Sulfurovum sp. NBC37-1]
MSSKREKEKLKFKRSDITFDDVVGHKEVKKRLRSIIKIIQDPEKLKDFDIPLPRGALLYGPPSIGKSMLAKAFIHEAGFSYLEISGSKLFELDHIKEVYDLASRHAPSVVLLEDIDIKGVLQGTITNVSFSDIAKVIESSEPTVFTIATAESLDDVDPVLTAPQKLDFLIEVSKLDKDARKFFIEKILEKPHDPKINVDRIVRYITGMSAMELDRLGRMAALNVIEEDKKWITEDILIEQINIIKYGHKIETQMVKNLEEELKMTAYHEAAHAVLSCILMPQVKIEQVTISRRSKMLGFVSYNAEDEYSNITKEEIFNDVCVLMAGRMSKIVKAGEEKMDSGAVNDLSQASVNIYAALTTLGMDKELGLINIESIAMMADDFLAAKIEERFMHWINVARERTEALVREHWDKIEKLALQLIEKEIVEEEELLKIVGKVKRSYPIPASL